MLFIESGIFKGSKIETVPNFKTRYTPGIVRLALVNMLDLNDKKVLDLCAGSGIAGLEFLSNGAGYVTFVDISDRAIKTISKNVKKLNLKEKVNLIKKDARIFLKSIKEKYDIVFMDPPFGLGIVNEILQLICKSLEDDGILIVEHSKREKTTPPDCLEVLKIKNYGDVVIDLYKLKDISQLFSH
ncbi:methyltransferase [Thermosipho melanesiensis]|uniref:Methyltransferase n=2 Tax=Thermosipho melanesiensis TaxID=46541 RepID=A0ABN4V1R5_9BACT|nr:16S rRNA (guanine(966)-N(2))-methyltransferase RsmD [Thermosipho melanesiensis]ABR30432.1 putative methyltransferase [Thermosipho melanesiensis BI429]APT73592.1 methyltransferase [Thermosipho melanesiensis]OOC37540.1 methyltransferase [Thermosipho melanesiensis]OOC39436.1 methyltransferase [Thermosipho melanesiensis]OOC39499.1 methyltransferase [Thermosipho melanesiensis]